MATDQELMELIREGDRSAFAILLGRYWSALVVYAEAFVHAEDSAEDVVQDTFVRVWRRRSEWTTNGSVRAFLYRVTRNFALNARRDREAERTRRERGGADLLSRNAATDPQAVLEASRLREEVEAAIEALPGRRRQVFVLSRFHQLSHQEIAAVMGIAPQTVANQMTAALSDLRHALAHRLADDA